MIKKEEEKKVIDYIKKKIFLIEKEENRLIRLQVFKKNKKLLISMRKKCYDIINDIALEKERHVKTHRLCRRVA